MLPNIPDEVMVEAELFAKKAFAWQARDLERYWRGCFGSRWREEYTNRDMDYGDAYCFASWAAGEVFKRHGFNCLEEVCDIMWTGDRLDFDEYPS